MSIRQTPRSFRLPTAPRWRKPSAAAPGRTLPGRSGARTCHVLRGGHRAGDDVHLGFQPHAAHAQRLAHAFLAVDAVFLGQDVQHLMVRWNGHRARGFNHAVDVHLGDFAILDRHHAVRVHALDVTAGDAGEHLVNLAVGHQFRLFQRALDGLHRGFDVHHHAALQTARRGVAHADDIELAVLQDFCDDRHNLGCADVEANQHVLAFLWFAHLSLQLLITCFPWPAAPL